MSEPEIISLETLGLEEQAAVDRAAVEGLDTWPDGEDE